MTDAEGLPRTAGLRLRPHFGQDPGGGPSSEVPHVLSHAATSAWATTCPVATSARETKNWSGFTLSETALAVRAPPLLRPPARRSASTQPHGTIAHGRVCTGACRISLDPVRLASAYARDGLLVSRANYPPGPLRGRTCAARHSRTGTRPETIHDRDPRLQSNRLPADHRAFRCAATCRSASRRCSPAGSGWTSGRRTRRGHARPAAVRPARRAALLQRQPPYRPRAEQASSRTSSCAPHRMAGEDVPTTSPAGTARPADRVEGRGGIPRSPAATRTPCRCCDFRDECRAIASTGSRCRRRSSGGSASTGDWARRYATMDYGSEAAIAAEIGKFLLNGALYRGLRPVMWSPVEKTALAEAEIEYHDRTSDTVWVRFPVVAACDPRLEGASVVIWTTTPWTMPGNRAIAYGPEIDYALVHVDGVGEGSLARVGEKLLVALALLPECSKAAGIATHHIEHVFKGADARRHRLRASAARPAATISTCRCCRPITSPPRQGTGFVHIAPGARRGGLRARPRARPRGAGDGRRDGTSRHGCRCSPGCTCYKATIRSRTRSSAAGGLLARGKLVHSYPHSWRSKAPLIFRATPQWFIRLDGPDAIREKALDAIDDDAFRARAGPQPARQHGRQPARTGASAASAPGACRSRCSSSAAPASRCAIPRWSTRIVDAFEAGGRRRLVHIAAVALPRQGPQPGRLRAGDGHRRCLVRERHRPTRSCWRRAACRWPADLYLEGSDQHRGWFQSIAARSGRHARRGAVQGGADPWLRAGRAGRKMSKSLGNVTAPQEVDRQMRRRHPAALGDDSDVTEDLRIGPEILKQQAELYRRLRNTLRWLLGSLAGFEDERARARGGDAGAGALGAAPADRSWTRGSGRRCRATTGPASIRSCTTSAPPTSRRSTSTCARTRSTATARQPAPACRAHRAGPSAPLPDHLARAGAVLHRGGGVVRAVRRGRQRASELFPDAARAWRDAALAAALGDDPRDPAGDHRRSRRRARARQLIGSSLQAALELPPESPRRCWIAEDVGRESRSSRTCVEPGESALASVGRAPGEKCARCWRVLPEVGSRPAIPQLCVRCADAVVSTVRGRWSPPNDQASSRPSPAGGRGRRMTAVRRPARLRCWSWPPIRPASGGSSTSLDLPDIGQIVAAAGAQPDDGLEPAASPSACCNGFGAAGAPGCWPRSRSPWSSALARLAAPRRVARWSPCALGAIAGGAVGNVIDRLRFGAVVDFIHAHACGWSWYVFNVADAAIVCGVAALVLDGLLPPRERAPVTLAGAGSAAKSRDDALTTVRVLSALAGCLRPGGLQRRQVDPHLRPDPRRAGRVPGHHPRAPVDAARLHAAAAAPRRRAAAGAVRAQQAEAALVPQIDPRHAASGAQPPASRRWCRRPAAPAPADIRTEVDSEAALDAPSRGFADRLLFWRAAAAARARRSTRCARASGCARTPRSARAVETGDTPIIQRRRAGLFSGLF